MQGSLPLSLPLLIASVAAAIVAITVGAARITQLRRLVRQRRHRAGRRGAGRRL
jgi:uncharacterized integral membrane protein